MVVVARSVEGTGRSVSMGSIPRQSMVPTYLGTLPCLPYLRYLPYRCVDVPMVHYTHTQHGGPPEAAPAVVARSVGRSGAPYAFSSSSSHSVEKPGAGVVDKVR